MSLKVGDEVRISESGRGASYPATVVKVGRTLVTLESERRWQSGTFRLDSQMENGKNPRRWFRTMDEVADAQRRSESLAVLKSARIVPDYGATLTTEQLEELAAVVKGWA